MTKTEILHLARQHLSSSDKGELAAELVSEVAQPGVSGVAPTVKVIGVAKWTQEDIAALQVVIGVAIARLRTAPVEYARPVLEWLDREIEPFRGNKA